MPSTEPVIYLSNPPREDERHLVAAAISQAAESNGDKTPDAYEALVQFYLKVGTRMLQERH
jgi:hypothetical protein